MFVISIINGFVPCCRIIKIYSVAIIMKIFRLFNQLFCSMTLFRHIGNILTTLRRNKNALNFVTCTIVITTIMWYYAFLPLEQRYHSAHIKLQSVNDSDQKQCYANFVYNSDTEKFRFPFMTDDDTQEILESGNNIFFHLTNCVYDGIVEVNPRQACAVESAARINSHLEVFLTFTSQIGFLNKTELPIVDALLSYPNIHIRNIDIIKYAENTPAQEWVKEGKLYKSVHFKSHISDFLRFISLYRWGGFYIDLDTIMLKNISLLGDNFAGCESDDIVASAVINMNIKTDVGRKVANDSVAFCTQHFDPVSWGANGPVLTTSVLRKLCKTRKTYNMTRENCEGFHVYDKNQFYAINYHSYIDLFKTNPKIVEAVMKTIENATLIHLSSKRSSYIRVEVGSPVAYAVLAEKYCPKVYHSLGLTF